MLTKYKYFAINRPLILVCCLEGVMPLTLFLKLGVLFFCLSGTSFSVEKSKDVSELETVRLQLKGFHTFQFAGYYAAKEQGFYEEEGLNVHILERNPKLSVVTQVVSNEVQYGVEDMGIITEYANGAPISVLAAIFQRSPVVFISKQSSGVDSPKDFIGKRIMMNYAEADNLALRVLLSDNGLSEDAYTLIPHSFGYQALIDDKTDVIASHLTDQYFFFKRNNLKINVIDPQNYGVDFYGDILFTSRSELTDHPIRAECFRRASLKGWQYALDHPKEIIRLISSKYNASSSLDQLRLEAKVIRNQIMPDAIPLGTVDEIRLRKVSDLIAKVKFSRYLTDSELHEFIFDQPRPGSFSIKDQNWLKKNPVIRLGIDQNFAPYEWLNNEGEYTGITIDYIRLLEQRLGVKFDFIKDKKSWPELLDAAKNNELDMLFSLIKTPKRSEYLNFTSPYFISPVTIISGQAQGYIGSLKRLNGKLVAIQNNHSAEELLALHYPEISVILTDSIKEALQLVAQGEAHAYIGDAISADYIMRQENRHNLMFSGQTEYQSKFRIGVVKNNPELFSVMKKALASISDKERNEISRRWLERKPVQETSFDTAFQFIAVASPVFILFCCWVFWLRKSRLAIRRNEDYLKAIFDAEMESVKVISSEGKLMQINPAGLALLDYQDKPSEIIGQKYQQWVVLEDRLAYLKMNKRVQQGESAELIYQIENINGRRWLETQAVPLVDPESGKTSILAVSRDITEKKNAEKQIWKHANFDSLTDLPNRRMFHDHLVQEIKASHRNSLSLALLFLDLDHFKQINDELGHQVGDLLLKDVAARVVSCVRESDIVSRLSGDEFTVILSELEHKKSAEHIVNKILHALKKPFMLGDENAYISVSIGIAFYPEDAEDSQKLIQKADMAMYSAKEMGRNRFSYFTQSMQDAALYRLQMLKDLHVALREDQFQLRYQPIVELSTGRIHKVEALLSWNHPTRGQVNTEEFIRLAEDSGLIKKIGDWVFEEAIRKLSLWQQTYDTDIQLSINKSPIQFNIKKSHYDWLHLLDKYHINGEQIVIEITESLLLNSTKNVLERLEKYRERGIQIAVDDFGTGYSALSYLNKFNLDYLKIDCSFTENIITDASAMALTEAITVMAHKLGLKVIAEGIETEEQLKVLRAVGCEYGQGFIFDKPLLAKDFELVLEKMTCKT